MRRRLWIFGLAALLALAGILVLAGSRRDQGFSSTIRALDGMRPVSRSVNWKTPLPYREQVFIFPEPFSVMDPKLKAELKPRAITAFESSSERNRSYGFSYKGRNVWLSITEEEGKTVVAVRELIQPGALERLWRWFVGLFGGR